MSHEVYFSINDQFITLLIFLKIWQNEDKKKKEENFLKFDFSLIFSIKPRSVVLKDKRDIFISKFDFIAMSCQLESHIFFDFFQNDALNLFEVNLSINHDESTMIKFDITILFQINISFRAFSVVFLFLLSLFLFCSFRNLMRRHSVTQIISIWTVFELSFFRITHSDLCPIREDSLSLCFLQY